MISYLVALSHSSAIVYSSHPLYCKIYLDLYSYFRLFWETSRHNTVQQWNNNADSIERRHRQAKTQSGKWAPGSINNYPSWDMLLIQRGGSLCSACFLNSSGSKSAHFSSGRDQRRPSSLSCEASQVLILNKPEPVSLAWAPLNNFLHFLVMRRIIKI